MFCLWEQVNLTAFVGARSGCLGKRIHCLSRQALCVLNSRLPLSPLIHTPCYNDVLSDHHTLECSAMEQRMLRRPQEAVHIDSRPTLSYT